MIQLRHSGSRKVLLEFFQESIGPDGTADGAAYGATETAHDEQQGQHGGDVLVVNRRKDSQLSAENEDTTGHGKEDLTHDNVPDVSPRLTEMDHQSHAEDVEGNADPQDPFKAARPADEPARNEQEHKRDGAERVADISCVGDIQTIHDLQEGGEVAGVARVGDLVCHVQETGAQDGAVREEFIIQERHGGQQALIEAEDDEHDQADYNHRDDIARLVAVRCGASQGKGEEEDNPAASEEDNTDH